MMLHRLSKHLLAPSSAVASAALLQRLGRLSLQRSLRYDRAWIHHSPRQLASDPKHSNGHAAIVNVDDHSAILGEALMAATSLGAFNEAIVPSTPEIGRVKYIKGVLARMDELGISPDLTTYDNLLNALNRKNGKLQTKTIFDALWYRDTLQSETAMDLLQRMENTGVIPDASTHAILLMTFGRASGPVLKCRRMAYWMRRFAFANPFAIAEIPTDPCEKAKEILKRIGGPDGETLVILPGEDFIVAVQSSSQEKELTKLVAERTSSTTLYIDGPFNTWFDRKSESYMILSSDSKEYGTSILGSCVTSTGTADSVKPWIDHLSVIIDGINNLVSND